MSSTCSADSHQARYKGWKEFFDNQLAYSEINQSVGPPPRMWLRKNLIGQRVKRLLPGKAQPEETKSSATVASAEGKEVRAEALAGTLPASPDPD